MHPPSGTNQKARWSQIRQIKNLGLFLQQNRPVWPDGYTICSIFGNLEQLKYAQ